MPSYVGGQAVIEGVMMRSEDRIATAVRKKGKIVFQTQHFKSVTEQSRFLRLPVVRGVVFLIEMTALGMRTLAWSADQQSSTGEEFSKKELIMTFAISILATIGLFVIAPYYLTKLFQSDVDLKFNLIDGGFRFGIFVGYLVVIRMMKDIRRVFQYHGAEHKAVNCVEHKLPLTVSNVRRCSRIHPRCGTSLLVFVIGMSIVLFSVLKSQYWYINIAERILLIPVIAGISYEVLKFSARHYDRKIIRAIVQPGLWFQRLTTSEPNGRQIEVAIAALKKVLEKSM
ncbi:DUF1385 domain-containing protein [Candidatus Woesearchaeota archaeon]|nr:DUF1385 domain-containing protein [Candidatus Woesearchaeota archaeon]